MDVVTYALCKKLVAESETGITKIELDVQTNELIFTMADGKIVKVKLPIKAGCVDIEFVTQLPAKPENNRLYVQDTSLSDREGNTIYRQWMFVDNNWKFIGISGEPIADYDNVGLVKPDGDTILIDALGTISVNKTSIENMLDLTTSADIDDLFPDLS